MAVYRSCLRRKVHQFGPEAVAGVDLNPAAALRLEGDTFGDDR